MKFYTNVLDNVQVTVLRQLGLLLAQQQFYLGGGTALALLLGHRQSVDFDWFTEKPMGDPLHLSQNIREGGIPLVPERIEKGTLHGTISGVRVSFLEYRYSLLKPCLPLNDFACSLASLEDLACMKLSAIAQRGARKDFIDLYALGTTHFSLQDMVQWYQRKYVVQDIGHMLYSLVYFDDALRERMPRMHWDTDWKTIQKTIEQWVREITQ